MTLIKKNTNIVRVKKQNKTIKVSFPHLQGLSGPVGLVWRGAYNSAISYIVKDAVQYQGSAYTCIQNITSSSQIPTNTSYWSLIAQKGDPGGTEISDIAGLQTTLTSLSDSITALIDDAPGDADTLDKLNIKIQAIQTILNSDNIDLDSVQEVVDAIESIQSSLSTLLVDDLTTGGTTKGLTAEQGKNLKILLDALTTIVSGKQATLVSGTNIKTLGGVSLLGAGDIPSSGGGGAWQVVESFTFDGSTQDKTFSGLNLENDGRYKIIFSGYNPSASANSITWYVNSDTQASNYRFRRLDVSASVASASSSSNILAFISALSSFDFTMEITKLPSRAPIGWVKTSYGTLGTPDYRDFCISWNSTSNITSITLDMLANMASGTKVTLLKLVTS